MNKIFYLLLLLLSFNLYAVLDITETEGLYHGFRDEFKYLSPSNGLLALKSVIPGIRLNGNYGKENLQFLCHRQITNRDIDCPRDNTTAIIQHLFLSPAGGRLAVSGAESDFFKHVTQEHIGKLLNAYQKGTKHAILNTLNAIVKDFNPTIRNLISDAWKKPPTNLKNYSALTDSYANLMVGAKSEASRYPAHIIEHAMLALAVVKAHDAGDLKPLLRQLTEFQIEDPPILGKFTKNDYDNLRRDKDIIYYSTPEQIIFYTLAYDKYDREFPPTLGTEEASFEEETFSACGEMSLLDAFNMFLADLKNRTFNVAYLKRAFPNAKASLFTFFTEFEKTYEDVESKEIPDQWAKVVSGLNVGPGPLVVYGEKGVCNIKGIGIDNALAVLEKLLNDNEITRLREEKKDASERREAILDHIFDKFSRPDIEFDWKNENGTKNIPNQFIDLKIYVNGKAKFTWSFGEDHFDFAPITGKGISDDWRKDDARLFDHIVKLDNGLNHTLLPFYLPQDKTAWVLVRSLVDKTMAPEILYGSNLSGAENKLLALNRAAALGSSSVKDVAPRWIMSMPYDEHLNKQAAQTLTIIGNNVSGWSDVISYDKNPEFCWRVLNIGVRALDPNLVAEVLKHLPESVVLRTDARNNSLWSLALESRFVPNAEEKIAQIVTLLLNKNPALALVRDSDHYSILHHAAMQLNWQLVALLLTRAPSLAYDKKLAYNIVGATPLSLAAREFTHKEGITKYQPDPETRRKITAIVKVLALYMPSEMLKRELKFAPPEAKQIIQEELAKPNRIADQYPTH